MRTYSDAVPPSAPADRIPVRKHRVVDFRTGPPQYVDESGNPCWIVTAAHFGLIVTRVEGRATIRYQSRDEFMMVSPAVLKVAISTAGERVESEGDALFIVPPGVSEIEVAGSGYLSRIVSAQSADLLSRAVNHRDYASGAPELTRFEPWPEPRDGFRLRHYRLADFADAALPGRAFRCTTLMVNITDIYPGARDSRRLKPHLHEDFEQITLTYAGRFAHHLRSPWGIDSTQWQPDEHIDLGSPSAVVLPARLIHTSQALEAGCWLVDIFGPPRMDFSLMPGFVRNASEYPLPHAPSRME